MQCIRNRQGARRVTTFDCKNRQGARRVTTFECKNKQGCPEGSEHGIGGLRMAPGDVAHVPRTPSPVAEAGPVARHFRSRARLRRLLVRLRRPTSHRSLRSLRRRGFAHYVRLRHDRSSLFCCRKIIPSHSFAALTALVVRRVNSNLALHVPRKWLCGLICMPLKW